MTPGLLSELGAAFLLGMAGSLHCVGMCGPIALALPGQQQDPASFFFSRLTYNLGRAVTYATAGAVFGLLGLGFYLTGMQQWLSIGLGVVLILMALGASGLRPFRLAAVDRAANSVKNGLARLMGTTGAPRSLFVFGLLNGLLPCGLVYVALAGAMHTGSPWQGAAFMGVFGLGTLPLMLATSLAGRLVRLFPLQRYLRPLTLAMALLLILRGLNLGIPYLSPDMNAMAHQGVHKASCH